MPRLTVTISDEQAELLDEISGDNGKYESKSSAVRDFIQDGERMAELEEENARLRREKRLIIENQKEHSELVEYVEHEKSLQERREAREERREVRENAPIWKRGFWLMFGKGDQNVLRSK